MNSRPRKTVSVPLTTSPSLRHSVSTHPAFWSSTKNIWLLHQPKAFFFEKSQHNKRVFNETLTNCIKKSILIEIKGFIFVFLNFTNSLNCEELLQFCIKICIKTNFLLFHRGFMYESNYISSNLQNTVVFVKSLNLCFY